MRVLLLGLTVCFLACAQASMPFPDLRALDLWVKTQQAEKERVELGRRRQAALRSVDLADRYKAMLSELETLGAALDGFSSRYNAASGQAVLLKEERQINEAMQKLIDAWRQLKRSEAWDVK